MFIIPHTLINIDAEVDLENAWMWMEFYTLTRVCLCLQLWAIHPAFHRRLGTDSGCQGGREQDSSDDTLRFV